MFEWIISHRSIFILIVFLEGLLVSEMSNKHGLPGQFADFKYFWKLFKLRQFDGLLVIGYTALAVLSFVMLGLALFMSQNSK